MTPADEARSIGGGHLTLFVVADGARYGTVKAECDLGTWHDVGRWHITADGQFCSQWHTCDGLRERYLAVYREGETFELKLKDRFAKEVYRRVLGNPEGY
jgi:hypothetical protein